MAEASMTPTLSNPADIDLPIGTWFWHVHHEVLCEPLYEPLINRLDCIRECKPEAERAIRLALISPIKGDLPPKLVKAGAAYVNTLAAYVKAWVASDETWTAYVKAGVAYVKAGTEARPDLEALHAIEHPGCPWNGRTIFA